MNIQLVPSYSRRAFAVLAVLAILGLPNLAVAQDFQVANGFDVPVMQNDAPQVAALQDAAAVANSEAVVSAVPERQIVRSKRLLSILRSGGPLMIPIGICSFILVVFVFERFISLRNGRIIPGPFTKRFLDQLKEGDLDRNSAMTLCDRNGSPIANVFRAAVHKWGRPAVEIEQAIIDEGERTANGLRRYLRLINGIATVCPLLGLLGTVLGMIHAFDAFAVVSNTVVDPKTMIATGISSALLTTAAGLTVAIPAYIAYLFFSSRVDRHVMEIDAHGQKLVNLISAEAISNSRNTNTRRKAA